MTGIHRVFYRFYAHVSSLKDAIVQISPWCRDTLLNDSEETENYSDLCQNTVVCSNRTDVFSSEPSLMFGHTKTLQLQDLTSQAIESLVQSDSPSVLRLGIKGFQANRLSSLQEFKLLHARVGDDVMKFLLIHCSIFIALPHNNYLQVTGPPLYTCFQSPTIPIKPPKRLTLRPPGEKRPGKKRSVNHPSRSCPQLDEQAPPPKMPKGDPLQQQNASIQHDLPLTDSQSKQKANPSSVHISHRSRKKNRKQNTGAGSSSRQARRLDQWLWSKSLSKRRRVCRHLSRNGANCWMKALFQKACPRRKVKRKKRNQNGAVSKQRGKNKQGQAIRALFQVRFNRPRMFHATQMNEAFYHSYVLNQTASSKTGARKLVMAVFQDKPVPPKKNGPPHTTAASDRVMPLARETIRGKKKPQRLSQRLLKLVPLFQKIISNHLKCRYVYLLKQYCPLPESFSEKQTTGDKGCSAEDFSKLMSAYSSHDQVHRFLCSVLSHIVPEEMWGSTENKLVFFEHLGEFVRLRRWELMSVELMMEGIKLSHCDWLKVCVPAPHGRRGPFQTSVTDSLKETELFSKWMLWLMNEIVPATVNAFFYVTEHSDHHNHMFYYRKEVWCHICRMGLKGRKGAMLTPISQDEVALMLHSKKTLGVSKLRFLPKTHGVRPIINLGSKVKPPTTLPGRWRQESVNYQLQFCFHALKFEKSRKPETVGSTSFGDAEIYQRLKAFKLKQAAVSENAPPLLFVHVDICNCYDSIISEKLYEILQRNILTEPSYLLRRFATVTVAKGMIRRLFNKIATTRRHCESFSKFAADLSQNTPLNNAILTDMVVYPVESRLTLLQQLKNHLYGNIVKMGNQCFRQTRGISQGSSISTLLCSFYYGAMEREHLPKVDPENGLMMRYVDDFLLISRDPDIAKEFLTTMTTGIPEYNCCINPKKTITNFEVQEDGSVKLLKEVEWIDWCGLLINTRTLEVQYDYSRYAKKNIRDNLTVNRLPRAFHTLSNLTKRAVQLRCLPVFLDCQVLEVQYDYSRYAKKSESHIHYTSCSTRMLSERTVVTNIYQGFLLAAVKFCAYIKVLFMRKLPQLKKHSRTFLKIVLNCISYFHTLATKKLTSGDLAHTDFTISKPLCVWLGCHAFSTILKRRGQHTFNCKWLIFLLQSKSMCVSRIVGLREVKRCLRAIQKCNSQHICSIKC